MDDGEAEDDGHIGEQKRRLYDTRSRSLGRDNDMEEEAHTEESEQDQLYDSKR
jgi:hypothetical protein